VSGRVRVHFVPPPRPLPAGSVAIVIDVLRATTTLTVAKERGALRVIAAGSPEEARSFAASHPGALLCGERDGLRIPGFDLGNSPSEYGAGVVAGRDLIFASTNGSLALIAAARARRRLIAAFLNASAAVEAVAREPEVTLVCAGKEGRFSLEDAGCAGWLARGLERRGFTLDPPALAARRLAPRGAREVRALVESADHARYLATLGGAFREDVALCATLDSLARADEV
jgi:2-phosphosulfolactate phosphatase